MLTDLLISSRQLRLQLVIGYSVLLTVYLATNEKSRTPSRWTGDLALLGQLISDLGTGGRTVLGVLVATLIGSLISNLFMKALVDRLINRQVPWEDFIASARVAAKRYEEYQPFDASGRQLAASYIAKVAPSRTWSDHLREELESRERQRDEVRFRMTLAIMSVPPALALIRHGGCVWLLSLVPGVLVIGDSTIIQGRTMNSILRSQIASLQMRKTEADRHLHSARKSEEPAAILVAQANVDSYVQRLANLNAALQGPGVASRYRTLKADLQQDAAE